MSLLAQIALFLAAAAAPMAIIRIPGRLWVLRSHGEAVPLVRQAIKSDQKNRLAVVASGGS
jgi:hypothetical protein